MGWFGGDSNEAPPQEKGFSDSGGASFSDSPNMYAGSVGGGGGAGGGVSDFQEFSMQLQQQVLIQQVITDLSQKAFQKCCTASTRDSTLGGKEVACITSVTNKWLDANELMAGRLERKQQQAAGGQQFG